MQFEDGAVLMSTHGLERATEGAVSRSSVFGETYRRFRERMKASQIQAPLIQTTTWAIRSKTKFKTLVSDLRTLVFDLERVTRSPQIVGRQQASANYEIASVSDVQSLQLIEDSAEDADRQLSDAASSRLQRIHDNKNRPDFDQSSVGTTFWSARSRDFTLDQTEANDGRATAGSMESPDADSTQTEQSILPSGIEHTQTGDVPQLLHFDQMTLLDRHPVLYSKEDALSNSRRLM